LFLFSIILLFSFSCKDGSEFSSKEKEATVKQNEFVIIIHGGAGTILKESVSAEKALDYNEKNVAFYDVDIKKVKFATEVVLLSIKIKRLIQEFLKED
jgi:hypothetical protein